MTLLERIDNLAKLGDWIGDKLSNPSEEEFTRILIRAKVQNPWFTEDNILSALKGIQQMLQKKTLLDWTAKYPALENLSTSKTVGAVLAGNIPMVGFHDLLCCLLCGFRFMGKLSSKDTILLPYLISKLAEIAPDLAKDVVLTEDRIQNFDLVIATGSDNSARYFDYYFGKYPNIIRKNRSSVAVLTGNETSEDYNRLADDVFLYFGLGCRSISKLYVPEGFTVASFYDNAEHYNHLLQHHKYLNNYEYNRALYLMNTTEHYDNGFCLLTKNEALSSPIGVLYFETYSTLSDVSAFLKVNSEHIQCIVSQSNDFHIPSVPIGQSQYPAVDDYADGIDTIQFLIENA